MSHKFQRHLVEQWCLATVGDAVKMFHVSRKHPDNEHVPLEQIAIRCANSAFEHVSETIVGDRDATARRYGELCYARFRKEIQKVITEPERPEIVEHVC